MDRTERFYKIDQLLTDRKLVSFSTLQEELEMSRATLKRDLEYMRNRLNGGVCQGQVVGEITGLAQ